MVTVIGGKPGGFARSFMESFTPALQRGAETAEKLIGQQGGSRKGVRSALTRGLSLYDQSKSIRNNSALLDKFERRMHEYAEEGYDPDDAFSETYREFSSRKGEKGLAGEGKKDDRSFFEKIRLASDEPLKNILPSGESVKQFGKDIITGVGKASRAALDYTPQDPYSLGLEALGKKEKRLAEAVDEQTGGALLPQNAAERLASGFVLGPAGIAGKAASEALNIEGIPKSVRDAAEFITFMALAGRGGKKPELTFANGVMSDAKKFAEYTGRPLEEIVAEAAETSGADLRRMAAGDMAETEKFSKALPEVAERVKGTPKEVFNPEGAAAERELFAEKVKESPLERYYEGEREIAEKNASRRPETVAKEAEIVERLKPAEKEAYDSIRREANALREMRGRGDNKIDIGLQQGKLSHEIEKLKDIQYEMRHGRPRATIEQLQKNSEKSIEGLRKEAENPTKEGMAQLEKDFKNDQEYIDRAAKISERGALPSDVTPDTFIRIKQKYADAYRDAIASQNKLLETLVGKDREGAERLLKVLKQRESRAVADIVNQRDKLAALRRLEKPSGAFIKHQLKGLKKDIPEFKKDFFRMRRLKQAVDKKVESVVGKKLSPGQEKIAEQAKEEVKETLGDVLRKHREKAEATAEGGEKAAEGMTLKEESEIAKKISKWAKGLRKVKKVAQVAAVLGGLQAVLEELGVKIPTSVLSTLIYNSVGTTTLGILPAVRNGLRHIFETVDVNRLRDATPGFDADDVYASIVKKRGKSRANVIRNRAFDTEDQELESFQDEESA